MEEKDETAVTTARINPFRGLRYRNDIAEDLVAVLAPPYDVISPEEQEALYQRHEKNVVRLILGRINDDDTDQNNRYTRSAATLATWLEEGTLTPDETPALYLYAQDFDAGGERRRRTGFICRRLIEPLGTTIHPHERTLSGPKTDRLNLTRACRTNFSQVFGLYDDPGRTLDARWGEIMGKPADISITDEAGEDHHLWIITDEAVIAEAQDFLQDKPIVIADGHHRYETALNYRNERRKADGDPEEAKGYDYVMMFLANASSEGFTVLATHRQVMASAAAKIDDLTEKLGAWFAITEEVYDETNVGAFMKKLADAGETAPSFGLYTGGGRGAIAILRDRAGYLEEMAAIDEPELLKTLDVSILQNLVFEKLLGVTREQVAAKKDVTFTIDPEAVRRNVDSGQAVAGFLLNPTDIRQVIEVAVSGSVMPQKSTYFYPKLISGLVMNPLE